MFCAASVMLPASAAAEEVLELAQGEAHGCHGGSLPRLDRVPCVMCARWIPCSPGRGRASPPATPSVSPLRRSASRRAPAPAIYQQQREPDVSRSLRATTSAGDSSGLRPVGGSSARHGGRQLAPRRRRGRRGWRRAPWRHSDGPGRGRRPRARPCSARAARSDDHGTLDQASTSLPGTAGSRPPISAGPHRLVTSRPPRGWGTSPRPHPPRAPAHHALGQFRRAFGVAGFSRR